MKNLNSCVPIVTPFRSDLTIDYDSLDRYVGHLHSNGIRAIVIGGSTGESLSLTNDERGQMVKSIQTKWPDVTLIGGIIASNWLDLTNMIEGYNGCQYLLVMPQLFIRPQIEDIRLFFNKATEQAKLIGAQIMLYNNPARLGVDIKDMYEELLLQNHVVGVKETMFDPRDPGSLPKITWWCGEDNMAIDSMKVGAAGMVSALSNVLPDISIRIASQSHSAGDEVKWNKWSSAIQTYRNPMAVKYLLWKMGLISSNTLRFALAPQKMNALDQLLEVN